MSGQMVRNALAVTLALLGLAAGPLPPGHHARVEVGAVGRLDWTFAVSNRSLDKVPADWTPDYDSKKQAYELFVPARRDPKQLLGAIVYISPGNKSSGFKAFENTCKQLGLLYVGVADAGNEVPPKKRVRIVLDVLDEVRRNYPVDPDRTYLTGFSGGGRIACAIGFALPEYIGGVMPICAAGDLREESWLRQRVIDRVSVALLTGEKDFNRGEVERFRGPMLRDVGVRTKIWTQAGLGHGIPNEKTLTEAVRWLEEGAPRRAALAKTYPTSHQPADKPLSREQWLAALFAEGKQRLQKPETLYSGLMQLQGCLQRWPDLALAGEAKKLLLDYDNRKDRPWEKEDIAEQRRFLIARARGLDAYASGELPAQYAEMRRDMAGAALELWKLILADGPMTPAGMEAKKRIPELEKLLKP